MIGWKELKPGITALKVKLLCSLLDISVSGRAFFTSVESDESDFMQYLQVSYFWTETTLDPGNKYWQLQTSYITQRESGNISDFSRRLKHIAFTTGWSVICLVSKAPAISGVQSYKQLCIALKNEVKWLAELKRKKKQIKEFPYHQTIKNSQQHDSSVKEDDKRSKFQRQVRCYTCYSHDHLDMIVRLHTKREHCDKKKLGDQSWGQAHRVVYKQLFKDCRFLFSPTDLQKPKYLQIKIRKIRRLYYQYSYIRVYTEVQIEEYLLGDLLIQARI